MVEHLNLANDISGKASRILFQAMLEIIGSREVDIVLHKAKLPNQMGLLFSPGGEKSLNFNQVSQIQAALENLHGSLGGLGLALRSGRACFKYGLREYGSLLGMNDLDFRLQPLQVKLKMGFEKLAEALSSLGDQRVRLVENSNELLWIMERCPVCWGRSADSPICHLVVGFLQEALYWLSSGKTFFVDEITCIAKGDATCTFRFDKKPLD
jgi:predicted hydrocarbon binding protein